MTITTTLAIGLLLIGVVFAAYVRLSPNDPARWHGDIASALPAKPGACVDQITVSTASARAVCLLSDPAVSVLANLDAIATTTTRTRRFAGDAASGRITWITRSALWGFPDFTTAQAIQTPEGTRLEIFARLRFGKSDAGVNAARLRGWLTAL